MLSPSLSSSTYCSASVHGFGIDTSPLKSEELELDRELDELLWDELLDWLLELDKELELELKLELELL